MVTVSFVSSLFTLRKQPLPVLGKVDADDSPTLPLAVSSCFSFSPVGLPFRHHGFQK